MTTTLALDAFLAAALAVALCAWVTLYAVKMSRRLGEAGETTWDGEAGDWER